MQNTSRSPRTRGRALAAAAVLAIAMTSGCTVGADPAAGPPADPTPSTSSPTTASARPTRTPPPAPVVGQCRYIAYGGFARPTDFGRITECDVEHTAETIWVGEVTGPQAGEEVPDYAVVIADAACPVRLTEHFGTGDWAATRLYAAAFVAPLQEWKLGARWVRCDVYLPELGENGYREGDQLFAPVTLDDAAFSTWRFCATYDPDEPELGLSVDCAEPHNVEAITPTLDLGFLGPDFPGRREIAAAADEHCFGAMEGYLGGAPPEAIIVWAAPDQALWELGDRDLLCIIEIDGGRVAGSLQGIGDAIEVIPFADGEDDPAIDPYAEDDPAT